MSTATLIHYLHYNHCGFILMGSVRVSQNSQSESYIGPSRNSFIQRADLSSTRRFWMVLTQRLLNMTQRGMKMIMVCSIRTMWHSLKVWQTKPVHLGQWMAAKMRSTQPCLLALQQVWRRAQSLQDGGQMVAGQVLLGSQQPHGDGQRATKIPFPSSRVVGSGIRTLPTLTSTLTQARMSLITAFLHMGTMGITITWYLMPFHSSSHNISNLSFVSKTHLMLSARLKIITKRCAVPF
mmetsp:Transcript_20913/g.27537  ORF Transcript_20913/g.27537 Transcript_20913/m.27537 type:complete len:237 (-) Transcript_20913:1948-2658(-)